MLYIINVLMFNNIQYIMVEFLKFFKYYDNKLYIIKHKYIETIFMEFFEIELELER